MKIGIDVRCFAHGKRTGVEGYAQHMLEALFQNDQHNEYILFFNALHADHVDWTWIEQYKNVSLKKYAYPNKILNFCLWLLQYPKIDRLCGNVDLFFMPNINFVALSPHVPLILTIHDLSFVHHKSTFSLKRQLWHYFVNPRMLIRRAKHIFAVSEYTKEDLCKTYLCDHRQITVALNGMTSIMGNLDRNSIELIDVKERYQLPYKFILYFGTIEPRKNIIGLVRAYDQLRQMDQTILHHLVLAGSRGWGGKEIDAAIFASPYYRDIHVFTDIPEEDKEAFFVLSSIFVYPSFFEGFGFPPLEAAICKKPIITSHTSSLSEVVGSYGIMIDPYRIEELTHSMYASLTQKDLGIIKYEDVVALRRMFSWQKNAQEMIHVMQMCGEK